MKEQIIVAKADVDEFLTKYGLHLETVSTVELTGEHKPVWDVTINAKDIPVEHTFIADGFVTHNSTDIAYLENMMEVSGIKIPIKEIFGVRDPKTNKWVVKPKVRYYSETVGEKFFDALARLERLLPDKVKMGDQWYFVYPSKVQDVKTNAMKVSKRNADICAGHFDKDYFKKTGMMRIPAPDGSLQAVLILDSLPAMLPERLDVDDAGSGMAAQARMFSDQFKRIKGRMKAKRIAVVGVNQLRKAPMVMFGCLHAEVKVEFTDGRVHTMKEIVDGKIKGDVWSMNEATHKLEPKKITAWHYNGEVQSKSDWIKIVARNPMSASGFSNMCVTPDHEIYTQRGWVKARKLRLSDKVLSKTRTIMSGKFGQFMSGVLSADPTIVQDCKSNAYLRLQDNENPEYLKWKMEKLSSGLEFVQSTGGENKTVYCSTRSPFFVSMKNRIGQRDLTALDHTALSLAVIYMDDGCLAKPNTAILSFKRFKDNSAQMSKIQLIFSTLGVESMVQIKSGELHVRNESLEILCKIIRKYVPEPMQYKLPAHHRGFYKEFSLKCKETVTDEFAEITKIEAGSDRQFRQRGKYDITVADNHNYLAGSKDGGFVVHNSPDYEPCGEAAKYFSDCRLYTKARVMNSAPGNATIGKGMIEEERGINGGVDRYRYIHVRAHKNKLSVPNLEGWLRLWITDSKNQARGLDPVWDTWRYLVDTGQAGGKRNAIKLNIKGHTSETALKWLQFKTLVLGTRAQIKAVCTEVGLKPFDVRAFCKNQLANGDGLDKYFEHLNVDTEAEDKDVDTAAVAGSGEDEE